jgi:asparagine synthase (glutamine-hydrolysing)
MCGITGFWTRAESVVRDAEAIATSMATAMQHRGPDGAGTWTDHEAGVALGHRRLAIIDLSDDGAQPMTSANGRFVIVFNGEIYNFRELRRDLETDGVREFRGDSDTEVLLESITRWGPLRAVEKAVGMFAFALWDRERRELSLVRDRLGIKPLYWGRAGDSFIFGSELSALCAFPSFERRVERTALTAYMRYAYVPAPHAIFEGVKKLEPGHILTVAGPSGTPKTRAYWDAERAAAVAAREPFSGTPVDAVNRLSAVLGEAVRDRMVADVPLGAFLSGGIDSSTVVALMQQESEESVRTFSIGFEESAYDESSHARQVADVLGTDHTELIVTPRQCLDVIPKLPRMYDEPFADSSQIPTFLVSELARRDVTVALSGDGGDELFGGYNRHLWGPRVWDVARRVPRAARRLAAKGMTSLGHDRWDAIFDRLGDRSPNVRLPAEKLFKLASVLPSDSPEQMYQRLVSQWPDPAEVVLRGSEPPAAPLDARLPEVAHQMMLLDATTYLPDDILTKVDRASMAVSLEARVPLLDHRVFEFAWSLPLDYKIRDGEGKWVLRRLLGRHVPQDVWDRPKMGFGVPIDRWLRDDLREWAGDLLSPASLRDGGFFDADVVGGAWNDHSSGRAGRHHQLWPVLMFEAWRDEWTG